MATDNRVAETLARAARRRRIQLGIIGVLTLLVLGVLAWAALQARNTTLYLKECTTPSTETDVHECYEDGQRRTGEAIKVLLEGQEFNRNLILCVLYVPPAERDEGARLTCEKQARQTTEGKGKR